MGGFEMIRNGKGLNDTVKPLKKNFGRRQAVMKERGREYDEVLSHSIWVNRRPLCRGLPIWKSNTGALVFLVYF